MLNYPLQQTLTKYHKNKDENVHRFALSAIKEGYFWRERERDREKRKRRERSTQFGGEFEVTLILM